ncbi:putative porin [Stanieria sp. NIES-3757]|nr:putative porin [Stanieria sp. NIES-3757]
MLSQIKLNSLIFQEYPIIILIACSGCIFGEITPALAAPEGNRLVEQNYQDYLLESNASISQVTSVSQLRDVQPTDWAYQALQTLVERYGCIVGYPNQTYRGNQAISRYEFAAGLNACLNQIERLIASSETVAREDLDAIKRLTQDFQTELATLRGRVDNIEDRTAFLEDYQFSTTTKLLGQVIWSVDDTFGDAIDGDNDDTQTRLAYRIRLNLESSFTGRDTLRTRLQVGNFDAIAPLTGTNMVRLNYDDNSDNQVQIPHLWYFTPLTENLALRGGPVGIGYTDLVDTLTPPGIADDGLGVPSKFGEYNPVYRRGGGGAGINWQIIDNVELSVGYVAGDANNPEEGNGLFNGTYHALAQLAWKGENAAIGFAYSHSYYPQGKTNLMSDTGSFLAIQPFGENIATSGDFYTLQGFYQITPKLQVHGWGGYVKARAHGSGLSNFVDGTEIATTQFVSDNDSADIWYGAVGLTFPDLGGEGNLGGVVVGIPPVVTDSDVQDEPDNAYHIETFYRFQINDYIAITPGFWAVINPENDSDNATQWVGHIRTSFNF